MKSSLTLRRFGLASIAGAAAISGLLLAAGPAAAADIVWPNAYWNSTFTLTTDTLVRYGDYTQPGCPMDSTCSNQHKGGQWAYKVLHSGPNLCADRQWWSTPNGAFATDPYPGRTKRCEVVTQYGDYKFAAAYGSKVPFTTREFVYYGMFDSNGLPMGTFVSAPMYDSNFACDAASFGLQPPSEPQQMACFKSVNPVSIAPPPTGNTYDFIENDGSNFALMERTIVRFGNYVPSCLSCLGQKWSYHLLEPGIHSCSVAGWGGDPWPGRVKICERNNPFTYSLLAKEGETVDLTDRQFNVRYGWIDGQIWWQPFNNSGGFMTGIFTCNNATFGDPYPNVVKACFESTYDGRIVIPTGG